MARAGSGPCSSVGRSDSLCSRIGGWGQPEGTRRKKRKGRVWLTLSWDQPYDRGILQASPKMPAWLWRPSGVVGREAPSISMVMLMVWETPRSWPLRISSFHVVP